jgi:hypothetical protein
MILVDIYRFLLAELHTAVMEVQRSTQAIRDAMETLPGVLPKAYESLFERIRNRQPATDAHIAETVLKLVTYAKKPLSVREIQEAVVLSQGRTKVDEACLTDIDDLMAFCIGLISVDRATGTIKLVHYTTQKFLKDNQFQTAQSDVAKICLTYLDIFLEPCGSEEALNRRLEEYKLSSYTARYWGQHTRGVAESTVQGDVFKIFRSRGKRESMYQIKEYVESRKFIAPGMAVSLLHILAENGLATIISGKFHDDNLYLQPFSGAN